MASSQRSNRLTWLGACRDEKANKQGLKSEIRVGEELSCVFDWRCDAGGLMMLVSAGIRFARFFLWTFRPSEGGIRTETFSGGYGRRRSISIPR